MPPKSRADRRRQAAEFRRRLLRWFRRHGRDLPWRRTRDPYHIVVSEFMLQQTQVSRVEALLPPVPGALSVHRAPGRRARGRRTGSWEGLGYYRRAANLHRLAQAVVADHGGRDAGGPGGAHSAAGCRAVYRGSGGVLRIRARDAGGGYQRGEGDQAGVSSQVSGSKAGVGDRFDHHAPQGTSAWAFNQAIMELGALVCTARVARCGSCPVRVACATGRGSAK